LTGGRLLAGGRLLKDLLIKAPGILLGMLLNSFCDLVYGMHYI
jgi:hypothetical protein